MFGLSLLVSLTGGYLKFRVRFSEQTALSEMLCSRKDARLLRDGQVVVSLCNDPVQ